MVLDARGKGGEERGDSGDCGPPSTGWLPREEEEAEVVRRDTSGELGAAQDGGDWRGKAAAAGARGARKRRARVRVSMEGEQGGEEREAARRGLHLSTRGGRSEGAGGGQHRRQHGHGGTVLHCGDSDGGFLKTPLAFSSLFYKKVQQQHWRFKRGIKPFL